MKSIAGSIITLAGAIIIGFNNNIPNAPIPTMVSLGLILTGLFIVIKDR